MFTKRLRTYFIFFIACTSFGCMKNTCVEKAGKIITIEKFVSNIDSIYLNDNINLTLTQGSTNKIIIECGENIQPYISTAIQGKTLNINNTIKCNWVRNPDEEINVYVQITNMQYLHYSGYGDIKTGNEIKVENFTLDVGDGAGKVQLQLNTNNTGIYNYGSADVFIKGFSNNCKAYTSFRGVFDFKEFEVKNFDIDFRSVFNGYINVTETLRGTIQHTGNIYYLGNPSSIDITTMNSGKLIKL